MRDVFCTRQNSVLNGAVLAVAFSLTFVLLRTAFESPHNDSTDKNPETPTSANTREIFEAVWVGQTTGCDCWRQLVVRDAPLSDLQHCLQLLALDMRTTDHRALLALAQQLQDDAPQTALRNLCRLFAGLSDRQQQQCRADIIDLAERNRSHAVRQVALACRMQLDGSAATAFSTAKTAPDELSDLLAATKLIPSLTLQAAAYDDIRPFIRLSENSADPAALALQRQAVQTAAELPGRESEKARDLIKLARESQDPTAAFEGIRRLPPDLWPADELGHLAAQVIAFIARLPAAQRDAADARIAFELADQLIHRLPANKRARFENRLLELTND